MNAAALQGNAYFRFARPEILELIPKDAKKVLDLGCGAGILGKTLKERQDCFVHGIEINKAAAHAASEHLDKVSHDNLNRFDPAYLKEKYDCIIFADILEHLISPWKVLYNFGKMLSDDGVLIASIPNIAHPWIISQLQKGLFRYELAGLLDITHLRFFTKTTICQLFIKAGLKIKSIEPHPAPLNPIQYLITATKPKPIHEAPKATILVLTYNCLEYSIICVNSIKKKTSFPHKIIVIDNGSTDGTVKHFRQDNSVFLIENSSNLGFGRGFNIGLELVDTPYFAICNNDIVVTPNWLTDMVALLQKDATLAAVGPVSNYVSGPQLCKSCLYKDEDDLDEFSIKRRMLITEPVLYFRRLVFFCTVFKSEMLSRIGFFDERFEIGNFEDDDYCMRIASAKLKTAILNTVFIHHYGSKTFRHNSIDYAKIMEVNKDKFLKKWRLMTDCTDCRNKN